jgi:hypothetical protein
MQFSFYTKQPLILNICSQAVSPSQGIQSWYTDKPVSLTAISFTVDCGKSHYFIMSPCLFHTIWSFLFMAFCLPD